MVQLSLSQLKIIKPDKPLYEGFKRSFYWNEYKSKIESKNTDNNLTRLSVDPSFQGVNRLYVLAFHNGTLANGNDGPSKINIFFKQ